MRTWIAIQDVLRTRTTFYNSGKENFHCGWENPKNLQVTNKKILTKDIFVDHAACMAGIAFDRVTEKLL
jgi:hypothetical protein